MKALTWGLSVALIFVAGLWCHLGSYEVAIRCVLAVVAAGMIFEAFNERQYPFGWQRAFLLASAVPFLTSFAARDSKGARID